MWILHDDKNDCTRVCIINLEWAYKIKWFKRLKDVCKLLRRKKNQNKSRKYSKVNWTAAWRQLRCSKEHLRKTVNYYFYKTHKLQFEIILSADIFQKCNRQNMIIRVDASTQTGKKQNCHRTLFLLFSEHGICFIYN